MVRYECGWHAVALALACQSVGGALHVASWRGADVVLLGAPEVGGVATHAVLMTAFSKSSLFHSSQTVQLVYI